jgi:ADP-heptose:LPS heptosyltransferase
MRILILQLKRIGDVILTTPVLAALREHIPGCHLTVALDAATAGLAPALDADRVLIRGPGFWRSLAAGGFDICLDLTGTDRSALATAVSRAHRRITWTRFARKPLRRFIYSEFIESSVKQRHTTDHHTDLLRSLGIHSENVPLTLKLPDAAVAEAEQALVAVGIREPFAVVHAGTFRPEKFWIPERWAEVIVELSNHHQLPVILTGSTNAAERFHLDAIQRALPSLIPDLAGKLSLLGTAAVLARARLLCAVDSAPVHLADALGTPLVALFGPTNPFHWRPRRATSRIVTPAGGESFSPSHPKSPMSDISTTAVNDAIRKLL